jgi:hypothetical protein
MRKSTALLATKCETTHQVGSLGVVLLLASLTNLLAACGAPEEAGTAPMLSGQTQAVEGGDDERRPPPGGPAVGLALEVEEG